MKADGVDGDIGGQVVEGRNDDDPSAGGSSAMRVHQRKGRGEDRGVLWDATLLHSPNRI